MAVMAKQVGLKVTRPRVANFTAEAACIVAKVDNPPNWKAQMAHVRQFSSAPHVAGRRISLLSMHQSMQL